MVTRLEPLHDWTNFWDDPAGKKSWLSDYPAGDRAAFELEVEGMVGASVPDNLGSLLRSYHACTWTWTVYPPNNSPVRPRNTTADLHSALRVATYVKEDLEASDVLDQLPGQIYGITRIKNGVSIPRPEVILPFPKEHLETFIQDLKAYAALTLRQFAVEYPAFLASLPEEVSSALHEELFELAMLLLSERLQSSTARS